MAKYQQTLSAGARLYYFDVRENTNGNEYISITEMNTRTKARNSIYIHPEHLEGFIKTLQDVAENTKINDS